MTIYHVLSSPSKGLSSPCRILLCESTWVRMAVQLSDCIPIGSANPMLWHGLHVYAREIPQRHFQKTLCRHNSVRHLGSWHRYVCGQPRYCVKCSKVIKKGRTMISIQVSFFHQAWCIPAFYLVIRLLLPGWKWWGVLAISSMSIPLLALIPSCQYDTVWKNSWQATVTTQKFT